MHKIKIPKIKPDRELTWHITLLAFFVIFVVVFALNVYSFSRTKKELGRDVDDVVFKPLVLREDMLNETINELEKKRIIFENSLFFKSDIEDPCPRSSTDRTEAF